MVSDLKLFLVMEIFEMFGILKCTVRSDCLYIQIVNEYGLYSTVFETLLCGVLDCKLKFTWTVLYSTVY